MGRENKIELETPRRRLASLLALAFEDTYNQGWLVVHIVQQQLLHNELRSSEIIFEVLCPIPSLFRRKNLPCEKITF